ncbi:MAG: peptidylprolyl isomerase [Planctomycetes bacterium]|nr:peptidylprolyl isomerase [Planctomycetota bacterium]
MKWNHDGKATNSVSAGVVPNCKVSLMTNYGEIVIAFYPEDAPNTVINFVKLARSGFYTGLTFHRIIKGFMMQGGCPRGDGTGDAGYKLKAEFNSRKHTLGTLSMARSQSPDSAGSQFFICFADAPHLDGNYTAFGYVAKGIEVVKDIETKVKTGPGDKPLEPVKIEKVTIIE